jgi:LysR family transcriptional regulator, cyn operon transcriptional activator
MNLHHLRTFVAIADHGGFARAADRLNLTQSAASRQILALEAKLDVRLFDRIKRRVRLTAEGEDLLVRSRRLLSDAESLGEHARTLKHGQTGTLRIGATPHVIETLLSKFLIEYRRKHPGVEVHLVEDGGASLAGRLESSEIQIAHMPAGDERFQGRLLYPMHVLILVPKTHRLARCAVVELLNLSEEPLLLLGRGFGSRQWFEAACRVAQIRPRILLESGAPHTLVSLVLAGYGLAILPSNAHIPKLEVRAIPVVHRKKSIGSWSVLAWDPRRFVAPFAEKFVEELVAHVRRDYPGRAIVSRAPQLPRPKYPTK